MKGFVAGITCLLLAACATPIEAPRQIAELDPVRVSDLPAKMIDSIEAAVLRGYPSISKDDYARFYVGYRTAEGLSISSEWVGPDFPLEDRPPGRYLVEKLPGILTHAGCRGVIRIQAHPNGKLEADCDVDYPIPPAPPPPRD